MEVVRELFVAQHAQYNTLYVVWNKVGCMIYGQGVEVNKYFCTWVWETKSVVRDDKEIQAAVANRKRGESSIFVISLKLSRCINNWISFRCKQYLPHVSYLQSVKPRDVTVVAAFVYIFQSYCGHCARRVCSQIAPSIVVLLFLKHVLWEGWWARYHINWWLVLQWHKFLWQRVSSNVKVFL